ncbi:tetratricopeptide repeat protein [Streptomyces sp. NPDC019990]|uniref:tetratricopeptide repeat protein n=1 Tax=Streptomyces sp. NPDC019990 TaxID=3154693 RepID=UPI0034044682
MGQDLRGPAPLPEFGEFFGREDELDRVVTWVAQHTARQASSGRRRPSLLVLHGPAGVGKSALAAAACRRNGVVTHWISLYDATRADVELTLLRLLGESRGSRAVIVAAAMDDDRAFRRTLRGELARRLPGRLLVLDGVAPPVGRALLSFLRDCPDLTVLVTSRHESGWRRTGARLLAVSPLDAGEARALVAWTAPRVFQPGGGIWYGHTSWAPALTDAARGLPSLARVASYIIANGEPSPQAPGGESGPEWLVRLALEGCTYEERSLLRGLVERNTGSTFTLRTVELLGSPDSDPRDMRPALDGLLAKGLVQRWHGIDTFCLPQPVTDAVPTEERESPAPSSRTLTGLWAEHVLRGTAALLDGRPPPEHHSDPERGTGPEPRPLSPHDLVPHVDEFMSLLGDGAPRGRQQDAIADGLALLLAVLGDAHRLVALHRLWPTLPVRRALSALAADLGLLEQARELYDVDKWMSPAAAHHGAALSYRSGRLADALSALTGLLDDDRAEDFHTAWALLVLGAVRCDRGEVAEAEQALLRAAALHRVSGCRRGLGWALLHSARVCLLSGREAEAERLLAEADEMLVSVADTRGGNWVTTERLRIALRSGERAAALELAAEAHARHAAAEDVRGLAWTSLHLAVWHLEQGDLRSARAALGNAQQHALKCGDDLGSAWAKHRTALLPSARSADHSASVLASLGPVWALFGEIGCPLGTAWTELEMVARRKPTDLNLPLLVTAEERFRALGDAYGLAWTATVHAVHQNHLHRQGPRTAEALVASLPRDIPVPDPEELAREVTRFWESGGVLGGRTIPSHSRNTVAVRHTGDWFLDLPGRAGSRCRVRVTLLDDSPAGDTTARLLLRVSPEDGHPWAAPRAERPWLTATASPLTHASVDPASALLLPSEEAVHGAEFGFTAHRTGTHRIRFTIALERTGTVLQQVETELDILDHDEHRGLTSPEAVTHRGR